MSRCFFAIGSPILESVTHVVRVSLVLLFVLDANSQTLPPRPDANQNASQVTNTPPVSSEKKEPVPPNRSSEGDIEPVEIDIDKASEHLTKGNEFLNAGKLEQAVEQFKLAVKFNPEDEDLYYNLGFALARQGKIADAKKAYQEALKIYPDYVEAHNNLGNLLVKEKKYDEAIAHFDEAARLDPESASARNNLGTAMGHQKRWQEAAEHFRAAVQLKPDYLEAQNNLANCYLLLGRADEAIKEFTAILKTNPEFEPAKKGLARARKAIAGKTAK